MSAVDGLWSGGVGPRLPQSGLELGGRGHGHALHEVLLRGRAEDHRDALAGLQAEQLRFDQTEFCESTLFDYR